MFGGLTINTYLCGQEYENELSTINANDMKKILFTLFLMLAAAAGWAASVEIDGIAYTFDSSTKEATVSPKFPNYEGAIVIPETVTYKDVTYTVTTIGTDCFWNSEITSLKLPDTVRKLAARAIYCCSKLTEITLPTSLESIGTYALAETGIAKLEIPEGVTQISDYAFGNSPNLTTVTFPASIARIGAYIFLKSPAVKDVYIYATDIPTTLETFFYDVEAYGAATLHVPAASLDAYKAKYPWALFANIVPIADGDTRVDALTREEGVAPAVYDLAGRRHTELQRGLNIVDGKKRLAE